MRVLVCGGRAYLNRERVFKELDALHVASLIDCIIEGGASGADASARHWALSRQVNIQTYPAKWLALGKRAGPIRNEEMLQKGKPTLVLAFPGNKGTADMKRRALIANIPVMEIEESKI